MHYYDPARPRQSNGLPMYCYLGRPVAALPDISVCPLAGGGYELSVFLLIAHNAASHFHYSTDDLPAFFRGLLIDPEEMFRMAFGWKYSDTGKPPTISLEDIGL